MGAICSQKESVNVPNTPTEITSVSVPDTPTEITSEKWVNNKNL